MPFLKRLGSLQHITGTAPFFDCGLGLAMEQLIAAWRTVRCAPESALRPPYALRPAPYALLPPV
jgi:hypothetical protein